MAVRLVVSINAAPGKGAELAQAFRGRCAEVMQEPGCQQFEVFQSVVNPDQAGVAGTLDGPGRARRARQGEYHARTDARGLTGRGRLPRRLRHTARAAEPAGRPS